MKTKYRVSTRRLAVVVVVLLLMQLMTPFGGISKAEAPTDSSIVETTLGTNVISPEEMKSDSDLLSTYDEPGNEISPLSESLRDEAFDETLEPISEEGIAKVGSPLSKKRNHH